MSIEINVNVIQNWIVSPAPQPVEEVASLSHETKRIPDPYIFILRKGKLVSPSNGIPVEEVVTRNTSTEEAEFKALLKIQEWADKNDEGMTLWFSPPVPYQNLKIVSSEIMYTLSGEKVILNRAIVLDVDRKTSLEIANNYSGSKSKDPEKLRSSPIFLSAQEAKDWMKPLSKYTDQILLIETGEDLLIKTETLKKSEGITSRHQAQDIGLMGSHSDSCSAFGAFISNAEKSFPCPRCHKAIPSGRGITKCPFCGVTKEQYGSVCN